MRPSIPAELSRDGMTPQSLDTLWVMLIHELTYPKYRYKEHHSRITYDSGCRGPLCQKAQRDYGWQRHKGSEPPPENGKRLYDEVLMFFWEKAVSFIEQEEARLVERLIS